MRIEYNCFYTDNTTWDETTQEYIYKGLESLTLTKAVTSLSSNCFPGSLKTLYVEATNPPSCEEYSLSNLPSSLKIYVPKGSRRTYRNANGWGAFYQSMEEMGIQINISGYGTLQQGSRTYSNGDVIFSNQSSTTTLKAVPQMGCELISVKLNGNAINAPDGIFTNNPYPQ